MRWPWQPNEFEEALVSYARTNAETVKNLSRRISALEETTLAFEKAYHGQAKFARTTAKAFERLDERLRALEKETMLP